MHFHLGLLASLAVPHSLTSCIPIFCFVSGGTATGTGKFLKSKKASVKVVAVEPAESAVLSGEKPGPHKIQGIGAGFKPAVLELDVLDEIIKVPSEEALVMVS